MEIYKVEGGNPLHGTIDIHGSKNAALPVLVATVINGGKSIIHNCPLLSDVDSITEILKILGCTVERQGNDVCIDSSEFCYCEIPSDEMMRTRGATLFAGALLARFKRASIAGCGGCSIGKRPIDIHIKAFRNLGVEVSYSSCTTDFDARHAHSGKITLDFPSVGATENVMLLASSLCGTTVIRNAAREPEIENLASYLRSTGVKISGDGSDCIKVTGTPFPTDGEVSIISDRIVAATYMGAVACTGGNVIMRGIYPGHISPVIALFRKMGMKIEFDKNSVNIRKDERCKNISYVSTETYPGFPTDCQPLLISAMAVAKGAGSVREKIFENRISHCSQLCAMGADISVNGRNIFVRGVERLRGANVMASDLRCGAALVVSALGASGITHISQTHYIDRGYENLCRDFSLLGAKIERIEKNDR